MKTALLWNTFGKDLEWFRYSAASYRQFARGWTDAACLVPTADALEFIPVCEKYGIRLIHAPAWVDKGFNWHQMQQCCADMLLPEADAIWHMDADCVFTSFCTPKHWMENGKLICSYFLFEELRRVNEWGPWMWKSRVDAAIGGDVRWSTMHCHPHCHYREVYQVVRTIVEKVHPEGFSDYVFSCENSYPQGFCEFETLGAVAQTLFKNEYHWNRLESLANIPSAGLVAEGWSHGGLDLVVSDKLDGVSTAREFFQKVGITL